MTIFAITVPDDEVPRVCAAFGKRLQLLDNDGNPRDATADEVRAEIANFMENVIRGVEINEARTTARELITSVGITID